MLRASIALATIASFSLLFTQHASAEDLICWGDDWRGQATPPAGLSNVVALAAGSSHSLALIADGQVVGWGDDHAGQATPPAGLSNVVDIAAASDFSLALTADGRVVGWGDDWGGRATPPVGLSNVVAIAAGSGHSLALTAEGQVLSWGDDYDGLATPPAGLSNVVAIAAGSFFSLALTSQGRVVGWGRGGPGDTGDFDHRQTTIPSGLSNVVAIAAGGAHGLALTAEGNVVGWGAGSDYYSYRPPHYGQARIPSGLSNVVAIAAGDDHSLALTSQGRVVGWGRSESGQTSSPTSLTTAVFIAAGNDHSLALSSSPQGIAAPRVLGLSRKVGTVDRDFYARIIVANGVDSLGAAGLPDGLAIDQATGVIRGQPAIAGEYMITLYATNSMGIAEQSQTLHINLPLPGIRPDPVARGGLGSGFLYEVDLVNQPDWLDASGLPAGLSIDSETGVIEGTPLELGDHTTTIVASNQYGVGSGQLTIRISEVNGWGAREDSLTYNYDYRQTETPGGMSNLVAISAGEYHSLALTAEGKVFAWGAGGPGTDRYWPGAEASIHKGQTTIPDGLSNVVAIAAGGVHSLALTAEGTVVVWGDDDKGLTLPEGLTNVVAIAAGEDHSLALTAEGQVVGWGWSIAGQARPPAGLSNVVAIAAGTVHSLALTAEGQVVGWGAGGPGTSGSYYGHYGQTTIPSGLSNVVAIAAGGFHSLALTSQGQVVGWGRDSIGQATPPVGLSNVVAIAAGEHHSLALTAKGEIVGWGTDYSGQLTPKAAMSNVVAIAAGSYHSLALSSYPRGIAAPRILGFSREVGTVDRDFYGRIIAANGVDSFGAEGLPGGLAIDQATGVISGQPSIAGEYLITLYATNSMGVAALSQKIHINLPLPGVAVDPLIIVGIGYQMPNVIQLINHPDSVAVTGLPRGINFDAEAGTILGAPLELGDYPVTLVLSNRYGTISGEMTIRVSEVVGWGRGGPGASTSYDYGQTSTPSGLSNVVGIAAGGSHSLALTSQGQVVGWGSDSSGKATPPAGLSNAVAVAAGPYHSLALTDQGRVVGWGYDSSGQATPPASLNNVVAVAAGGFHSLALTVHGLVFGWGSDGSGRATPPAGLSNVVAIAAGEYHSLALTDQGRVVGWGYDSSGQATPPASLSNVVAIAAGGSHSLALTAEGRVVGWGYNWSGEATPPTGLSNVVAIAAGGSHSLALTAEGEVVGWGRDNEGQTTIPSGLNNVAAIAAGGSHSLALMALDRIFTDHVVTPGATITLTSPTVTHNLSWYHNGNLVHIGRRLRLADVHAGELGEYVAVEHFSFGQRTNTVIHLSFGPELSVAALDAPLEANSGVPAQLSWTVVNQGQEPASGGWVDRVYLSDDPFAGNDRLVGEFTAEGTLATNASLPRIQSVILPEDLEPNRDYWWVVVTDAAGDIAEEDEANNGLVSDQPMRVKVAPTPNLQLTSVTASSDLMSGKPATVTWTTVNSGPWSTGAGLWEDEVYLSASDVLDETAVPLGRVPRPAPLSTNESYASSLTAVLPRGIGGSYYFIVETDADNRVNEGTGEGDNITASSAVGVTLTPPPDLHVADIQVPDAAASGTAIPVSWSITNAGPGATVEDRWLDEVLLMSASGSDTSAISLGVFEYEGQLASGESYTHSASLLLPPQLAGTYQLAVHTDVGNAVFEHLSEDNNLGLSESSIVIALTPPPDLAVTSVDVPATALASHSIAVDCVVANQGADPLLPLAWEDRLYLSADNVLDGLDWHLGSQWHWEGLSAGESYTNSFVVTLPDGLSGPFFAIAVTDAGSQVFELELTNNRLTSDSSVWVESRPADLVVEDLQAPAIGEAGGSLLVSWSVQNEGTGDTVVTRWNDRLVLSYDSIVGNVDDVPLLKLEYDGLLGPGETYSVDNQVVTVPISVAPGTHRLFLVTDSDDHVFEGADEGNNTSASQPISISRETADLRVVLIDAPVSALSEETILVSWTIENDGSSMPGSPTWTDAIYLSAEPVLDTNAVLLGFAQNLTSLAPGASYTNSVEVTLPAEIDGEFHVLALADAGDDVIEDGGGEANNALASAELLDVELRPVPDLEVVAVTPPQDGFSGQPIEMSWTITNSGPITAEGTWFDSVYLSLDPQFEPELDVYIGYAERPQELANGQAYSQTVTLEVPPHVSGLLYAFVVCDSTDQVNERGAKANNVGSAPSPVSIWIRPPADLLVGTITIPADAVAGQDMALSYVMHNQGTNGAFGPWVDALYLSADDQWDVGDAPFAMVNQDGFLAVGESRTNTVTAPAPGVVPGDYQVIVRSDIVNQVPETDEFNNISVSLDQIATEVEELQLDVPALGELSPRQARYYRVNVTSRQWLVIELECDVPEAATEMYVSYGTIPTRSAFDYKHSNPLQADQRIVVPNTKEGDYYVLVYGDFVPQGQIANTSLRATLSHFLVFDETFGVGGNAGNLTIPISGVDFDRTCTLRITDGAAMNRPAIAQYYESSTRFFATLDLLGLQPGLYDIVVEKADAAPVEIPNALEVVATGPPPPVIPVVNAPKAMRRNVAYTFTVQWANNSLNDVPAPLLTVGNTAPFGWAPGDYSLGTHYLFLGINTQGGAPGILPPGHAEMMTFHSFSGIEPGGYTASADRAVKPDTRNDLFPWEHWRGALITQHDSFDVSFDTLVNTVGATWGEVQAALQELSNLLVVGYNTNFEVDSLLRLLQWRIQGMESLALAGRLYSQATASELVLLAIMAVNRETREVHNGMVFRDGSFLIPHLSREVYEIELLGGAVVDRATYDLRSGAGVHDIALFPSRGIALSGAVIDESTQRPIVGARIAVADDMTNPVATESSAFGRFVISDLPVGSLGVTVSAEGYGQVRRSIQTSENGSHSTLVIALKPEGIIHGVVRDADTQYLLDDVFISLSEVDGGSIRALQTTTHDGSFIFDGLAETTYELSVRHKDYNPLVIGNVLVRSGDVLELGPIGIEVLGNAEVKIHNHVDSLANTNLLLGAFQGTNLVQIYPVQPSGICRASSLAESTYTFELVASPIPVVAEPIELTVHPGQTTYTNFVVQPGATVHGTVLGGTAQEPMTGVPVILLRSNTVVASIESDANGYYRIEGIPIGDYRVGLGANLVRHSSPITVSALTSRTIIADFIVPEAIRIVGSVAMESGEPLPDAVVTFSRDDAMVTSTLTDEDGYFLKYLLFAGEWSVSVSSTDTTFLSQAISTRAGDSYDLKFSSGRSLLNYTVQPHGDSSDEPVVALLFHKASQSLLWQERLGGGAFQHLAAGGYQLAVLSTNGLASSELVLVEPNATQHALVSLEPSTRVYGTVTDDAGVLISNATIELTDQHGIQWAATTDDEGGYRIDGVPSGPYELAVRADGMLGCRMDLLFAGGAVRQDMTVKEPLAWAHLYSAQVGQGVAPHYQVSASVPSNCGYAVSHGRANKSFSFPLILGSGNFFQLAVNGFLNVTGEVSTPAVGSNFLGQVDLVPAALAGRRFAENPDRIATAPGGVMESDSFIGRHTGQVRAAEGENDDPPIVQEPGYIPPELLEIIGEAGSDWEKLAQIAEAIHKITQLEELLRGLKSYTPPEYPDLTAAWLRPPKQRLPGASNLGCLSSVAPEIRSEFAELGAQWKNLNTTLQQIEQERERIARESDILFSAFAGIDFLFEAHKGAKAAKELAEALKTATGVRKLIQKLIIDKLLKPFLGDLADYIGLWDPFSVVDAVEAYEYLPHARKLAKRAQELNKLVDKYNQEVGEYSYAIGVFVYKVYNVERQLYRMNAKPPQSMTRTIPNGGFAGGALGADPVCQESFLVKRSSAHEVKWQPRSFLFHDANEDGLDVSFWHTIEGRYPVSLRRYVYLPVSQVKIIVGDPDEEEPEESDSEEETQRPESYDPNDMVGPDGYGAENWITPGQTLHYTVRFENDAEKAEAPAQVVRITHPLDPNLDLRTFRLGVMGFGTNLVDVPSDRTFYQTRLSLTNTLGVLLDISAALDLERGEVTWEFLSLDPATGEQPFNPFHGFLPPNKDGTEGQGFVTYTIEPKDGVASGDLINAEARIFFDYTEPIETPRIFNTIDADLPSSVMLALPQSTNSNIFPVRWFGGDAFGGSGVSGYDVYVSDNGGAWSRWLTDTPYTERLFVGECDHTYSFYTVARDNVGHVESVAPAAQASIRVLPNAPPILEPLTNEVIHVGGFLVVTNVASDNDVPAQSLSFSLDPGAPVGMTVDAESGLLVWSPSCAQGNGTYPVTVRVTDDGCGNESAAQSFSVSVTECIQVGLGNTVAQVGSAGCVPVFLESSDGLTNLSFVVEFPPGRFTDLSVQPHAPEVDWVHLENLNDMQALVTVAARAGQEIHGPVQVAEICFSLPQEQSSAFVWIQIADIVALRPNGTAVGNTSGQPGRVAVVGPEPLLEAVTDPVNGPGLIVYGLPGRVNRLESRTTVDSTSTWTVGESVAIPEDALFKVIQPIQIETDSKFYRAVEE